MKRNLANGNLIKKICLKGIWFCSFHGQGDLTEDIFLIDEHLASRSTKTTKWIDFELFTNISNGLQHKRVSTLFLTEFSIFYYNTSEYWKRIFHENNKKQIIQKIFQKKKIVSIPLFASWFVVFQWKKIAMQELRKVGKSSFFPKKSFFLFS